jgi:hypothetical protein
VWWHLLGDGWFVLFIMHRYCYTPLPAVVCEENDNKKQEQYNKKVVRAEARNWYLKKKN